MRINLKFKILTLVIIPTIVLLFYGGVYLQAKYAVLQNANAIVENGKFLKANSLLIHEAQVERAKTSLFLGNKIEDQQLVQQQSVVDEKMVEVIELIKLMTNTKAKDLFFTTQKKLTDLRNIVKNKTLTPAEGIKQMTEVISALINIDIMIVTSETLNGIEMDMLGVTMLELGKESGGRLRANILNTLNANKPITNLQISALENLRTGLLTNLTSPALMITDESHKKVTALISSNEWQNVQDVYSKIVNKASEGNFQEDPQTFFNTISNFLNVLRDTIQFEINQVQGQTQNVYAATLRDFSMSIAVLSIVLIMIAMLATILIRKLTHSLTQITEAVGGSAEQVSAASIQITQSVEKLSSAAQTQASSLEQTSASLTEISGMAGSNVKGAEQADNHAKEVYEITSQTRHSMEELSTAMSQILESNDRIVKLVKIIETIGEKTEIIDDIVFKTQLLSFNASVEAERAGDHGRGFAVVAQEVGNLAQMSGNAATEITSIVQNSIKEATSVANENKERVENGGKLANSTKDKMELVLAKLTDVIHSVSKIADSSKEQSHGVGQITSAIESLSHETQDVACVAEQSAGASEELSGQAQSLLTMVNELQTIVTGTTRSKKFGSSNKNLTEQRQNILND